MVMFSNWTVGVYILLKALKVAAGSLCFSLMKKMSPYAFPMH